MQVLTPSKKKRAGFSLAELMVVIVIIGLLATMVVPKVVDKLFTSQVGVAKSDIVVIKNAIDTYVIQNQGNYPDSLEALVQPDESGSTYLDGERVPIDPWGNEYLYDPPSGGEPFRVYTLGADGSPGGEGKDQDMDHRMILNKEV